LSINSDSHPTGQLIVRPRMLLPALLAVVFVLVFSVHLSAQETGPICFWSDQGPVCVERRLGLGTGVSGPEEALTALLAGPTPPERAQGIWSAVPGGTTLEGLEVQADRTVVVRLEVPPEPLRDLDNSTFEAIVHQIAWTLEPLGWRDLRIETRDPSAKGFVPLADFLPQLPAPRKETLIGGEEGASPAPGGTGQPPAPGQGQPPGGLSGKTVYVSAGHGWQWWPDAYPSTSIHDWRVQRIPYPRPPYEGPIIEDHNNAEAVNQYLLQYLWNAGAQVWPVRERDMNSAEVVVDNDDAGSGAGYSETGVWTSTAGTGYAGTDFRQAVTVEGNPTATAVWTATLPADGQYAVYVWYRSGSDRSLDAHYTVHHAGGETTVVLDQRRHGITWHYIGTYGFQAGSDARVVLTNQSTVAGRVLVADAVRFGGGVFDDLTGIETDATFAPDEPWWEMAAFYQVQRMGMDQPVDDVVARPIYARWEHVGTGDDAVYVSWHTNGVSGYQWHSSGTVSIIHNGEGLPITPGSEALRDAIHAELVHDIQAGWDADWPDQKRSMNLGELRLLWDSYDPEARMPGALIEVAYHDHPDDTDALKDPRFNMLAARAMYQGILSYFEQRDGIDLGEVPEPPRHLAVQNASGGQVRISWRAPLTDAVGLVGDAATGYRVYTSTNGIGWSNGVPVATTAYTVTGLSEAQLLFVRVTATNDGGASFPTETLAARVGDDAGVLLVSGFDRMNSTMTVPDHYAPTDETHMRVFLDQMNRYDYTIQHGECISYPFDSASNEAVRDGYVNLSDYAVLDWILGEESVQDETLDATERALLESFLNSGGALFLSGTEIGYHLDREGDGDDPTFHRGVLRAEYTGDDAGTYEVGPAPGSIFEGLGDFRFDASGLYDADYPDQIAPIGGSVAALVYRGGEGGNAAVQYADGCERLVYLGFPFETISPDQRPAVMGRVLGFLDECLTLPVNTAITAPANRSAYNTVPAFEGSATAGGAMALDRVRVQVERVSDEHYWTGSDWVSDTLWVTGTASFTQTAWVTATGTLTWVYALPALSDGDYRLRARAWTAEGAVDPSPAEVVFTYDTISPTGTTLIAPADGVSVTAGAVTLAWEPAEPDEGSGLTYVVRVDGQSYTTTQAVYTVTAGGGQHTWGVQVFDAAGNRSEWSTGRFYVNVINCWLPLVIRSFEPAQISTLVNGGFEADTGWVLNRLAVYDTGQAHSGLRSARVGILPGDPESDSYSSVAQTFGVPAGEAATLRLWVYPIAEEDDTGDWHYVSLYDQAGSYHALDSWRSDVRAWVQREYDLGAFTGQQVTLYIGTRNDGDAYTSALYVDDVTLDIGP